MPATFQERYDTAKPTYIRVNDKRFADLPAGSTVLIPSPHDIARALDAPTDAGPTTFGELRQALADRHGADGACPVMTGMNLRVVAEVALEGLDAGVPVAEVPPVWRVIDPTASLATKLPGGAARIRRLRSADPHRPGSA